MADQLNWTLREKIGQLVMCGFEGRTPPEGILRLIRDYKLGGIIYFRRNIGSAAEVAALSEALQQAAREVSEVPLGIAVDQEGGMVARIDRDVPVMPGNMAIGAAREPEYAYAAAKASGEDLRRLGISINFAPCVDVNNNSANPVVGVRSFGEDPELAARLGAAAVRGYQEAGISACAKHFPGHGDTSTDSHYELPVVPHDRERLHSLELVPFKSAIAAGADAIMTAHVVFPAYDASGGPATLSPAILDGLLRRELGFGGVIVTDCLEMKAISGTVGIAKGAVAAFKAGADLILVSHRLDRQIEALEALYEAAVSGEISESRINESVERVTAMKRKRAEVQDGADDSLGSAHAHEETARLVSEKSVTLVRNTGGALPLKRDVPVLAVWPSVRNSTEVDEVIDQEVTLGKALAAYVADVREAEIGTAPDEGEIRAVLEQAAGCGQIVVGTYNAVFSPGQIRLVKELLKLGHAPVTAVALRNPYDLLAFPDVHAYAACYENRPLMLAALAKVLTGEIPAAGQLPVSLSEEYPYGFGLQL